MDSKYCYPGTDVLINKFGIHNANELHNLERQITSARAMELEYTPVQGKYDLAHLQQIHKRLLGDLYSWAGQIRDVRIAKGNMFCYPEYIRPMADEIFTRLLGDKHLKNLKRTAFIEQLAYYMGEVNALHPFREGNGRTQRIFFTQLAREAGYNLNLARIDKSQLLQADIASMAGSYGALEALLNTHLEMVRKPAIKDRLAAAKIEADRLNADRAAGRGIEPNKYDRGR